MWGKTVTLGWCNLTLRICSLFVHASESGCRQLKLFAKDAFGTNQGVCDSAGGHTLAAAQRKQSTAYGNCEMQFDGWFRPSPRSPVKLSVQWHCKEQETPHDILVWAALLRQTSGPLVFQIASAAWKMGLRKGRQTMVDTPCCYITMPQLTWYMKAGVPRRLWNIGVLCWNNVNKTIPGIKISRVDGLKSSEMPYTKTTNQKKPCIDQCFKAFPTSSELPNFAGPVFHPFWDHSGVSAVSVRRLRLALQLAQEAQAALGPFRAAHRGGREHLAGRTEQARPVAMSCNFYITEINIQWYWL